MPFTSEAQRRKFHELVRQGKMSQETLDRWEKETPPGPLPERLHSPEHPSPSPHRPHSHPSRPVPPAKPAQPSKPAKPYRPHR